MPGRPSPQPLLLPHAGPLITLAYAEALALLLLPNWSLRLVDMVLHEVTRNATPTSEAITAFVAQHRLPVIATQTYRHYQSLVSETGTQPRKAGLGGLAIQEAINQMALQQPPRDAVLLFEDHKIAQASFHLPEGSLRISTRAFLIYLQQAGSLDCAAEIERRAVLAGRRFSQLRFPR